MKHHRQSTGLSKFEPFVGTQFLPGCPACGCAHPVALKAANPEVCPGCGAPVAKPGAAVMVKAKVTGVSPTALAARFLLAAGEFFSNLAKRFDP